VSPEPFRISIPEADLDHLAEHLRRARFANDVRRFFRLLR